MMMDWMDWMGWDLRDVCFGEVYADSVCYCYVIVFYYGIWGGGWVDGKEWRYWASVWSVGEVDRCSLGLMIW